MTLEQVFWASQSLAAAGVIASLIFIGLQVRGSMKAVRAATEQACQENFAGIYVSLQSNPSTLEEACADPSRARKSEIQQDKLLEVHNAERLDIGTAGEAIDSDPAMATVGAFDRTAHG